MLDTTAAHRCRTSTPPATWRGAQSDRRRGQERHPHRRVLGLHDRLHPGRACADGDRRVAPRRRRQGAAETRAGTDRTGASRVELVNVEDAPAHPAFRYIAATGEAPFHGFIGVPILRRRKVLGVLVAQQRAQRKYTADEESFLVTLAAQLAGCINQAEIRQALERLDDDVLSPAPCFWRAWPALRGVALGEAVVVFPGYCPGSGAGQGD
jgi:GAF domain-containing protein